MAISLYELSVPTYLQTLGGTAGFLEKGLAHCREKGIDPDSLLGIGLFEDMRPFQFQIEQIAHHSKGAIDGLKAGSFSPVAMRESQTYAGLQQLIAETQASLQEIRADELNALEGKDMAFVFRERNVPFTAEGFVLSFSLPNFYFHATTAYDILRNQGVSLGKRDFMGPLRMRG